MYVEKLITPHVRSSVYEDGSQQQPLLAVLETDAIRDAIARESNPDKAKLEGALHIQRQVHNSLQFALDSYPSFQRGDTIEDTLREDQYTNCHGYALTTSEALSMAGIQNYILYFKGHFMNGITTGEPDNPQLHMFDVKNTELSQNITNTLRGTTVRQLLGEQASNGRGAARIDTEQLLDNVGFIADEFTNDPETVNYNWLYYQKGATTMLGRSHQRFAINETWARRNRYTCFLSAYSAEMGRRILPAYATFSVSTSKKTLDVDAALHSSGTLSGLFPELDARLDHSGVKTLVRELAKQGRTDDALTATFNYCTSFGCSTDPRLKGLEAGRYYDIAVETGDKEVAALGLYAYRQALGENSRASRLPFRSHTYQGKMTLLEKIISSK